MKYVFAFVEPPVDVLPRGFDGAPVDHVTRDGVAAVVTEVPDPPAVEPEALWRHEAVAEALLERGAVLPARFGTVLADAAAVRGLLDAHADALAAALERVRGRVEIGVRLRALQREATPAEPAAEATSGRGYLERRRAEVHAPLAAAEAVHERLRGAAVEAVSRPGRGRNDVLLAAYLVDGERVEAFLDAVRAVDAEAAGLALVCTGPWPPYSFAPVLGGARDG